MTLSTLMTAVWQRLDEPADGTGYYSAFEIVAALNRAQRLFALLSLCLETSDSLTLTAGTTWYHLRDTFPDWLVPLRVTLSGAKIRPATVAQLAALNNSWEAQTGTISRYAHVGMDMFAAYPHPAGAGTSLTVVYARVPTALYIADDTPDIDAEYHPALVDGAIPFLRLKEGGQALESVLPLFQRFLECAGKAARSVRARSLDLRYDTMPAETITTDLSRALEVDAKRPSPWKVKE